ncbi:MAG: InlB B-repeat-containing protein, partial [Bacteroidaceae bacterium]|nr:InlB B-repeat-containing protein [Bacteroidaceae bacterium]
GKVITEETVEYGAKITAPNAPEKEGHTFNGWTNVPSTMPAKDVTVTGAYTVNKYKLTFIVDGTVVAEETVEYGANITAPNAPEKEGHTFSGWTNLPSTMPAKDVTVTGAFATKTYKLTYTIDGQVITEESLEYGANITAPNAPEKEGYTFNGWANVPSTMPAKDVTVTGSYTVNKYKLTFIIDGTVVAEETVEYGANITAPKAPEKEGHTFTWVDMPNTMPATDVTVIGSFVVNKYKLTYVIDGEVVIEETVEYGASITAAEGPEKEGHTFNGWTDVPSTMPASDVTITGSYTVNKYELTFIVNGEVISQETIDYGTDCAAPQMPEREGYTFVWTNMPSTMPAGDTTISGEYVINKYNLIYVIDGEVVIEETVEYGASITAAEDPEKEGHTFNGWTNVPSTMPASDVTIFGSYTVNKYKLTYILDDEVYAEYSVEYGSSITPIEVNLESDRVFNGWQDLPETMPANDVVVYGTTMVSSITNVLDTTKTFDVYSLTGKLVAKQVNQAWIKTNLKTGIYIINNKKYIVK